MKANKKAKEKLSVAPVCTCCKIHGSGGKTYNSTKTNALKALRGIEEMTPEEFKAEFDAKKGEVYSLLKDSLA